MQPEIPRGTTPEVFFILQFSQEIQSLQNAHHPDHPQFDEIQASSGKLLNFMNSNESKIKQLCEKKDGLLTIQKITSPNALKISS